MLKASLQLRLGQQLTMTPQLQQAIRLLQLPSLELQAHIRELLETNVMLEAEEESDGTATFEALGAGPNDLESPPGGAEESSAASSDSDNVATMNPASRSSRTAGMNPPPRPVKHPGAATTRIASRKCRTVAASPCTATCNGSWRWQSWTRATVAIGRAIIDAINDDGYLTEPFDAIAATLKPEIQAGDDEIAAMLEVVQSFDPLGIGARTVGECVTMQLRVLDPDTPGLAAALAIAARSS